LNLLNYKSKKKFSQKHLLTLEDYSTDDILQVLSLALKLKAEQKSGIPHKVLEGKSVAMIFTKSSTRTRVSFEVGIHQLGAHPLFLSADDIQLSRGEPISDTVQVLSRYVDGIMIRTYNQSDVVELAEHGSIPVINGLTDDYHPCQVLADLMTVYEKKGTLKGLKLAYIGDGNNMANSLIAGCVKVGMDVSIACPEGYLPLKGVVERSKNLAEENGCEVVITQDMELAAKDADILYTDVWTSMGQEDENEVRLKAFNGYQVNSNIMSLAKGDAIFLHCLPAHRGEEVTAEVIDGPQSVVLDEAENRLHAQKAVMALLMGKNE
jgi:ornithine carbamoyltransferase